jgi:hypothetical protein
MKADEHVCKGEQLSKANNDVIYHMPLGYTGPAIADLYFQGWQCRVRCLPLSVPALTRHEWTMSSFTSISFDNDGLSLFGIGLRTVTVHVRVYWSLALVVLDGVLDGVYQYISVFDTGKTIVYWLYGYYL